MMLRPATAARALLALAVSCSVLLPAPGCLATGSSATAQIALSEYETYAGDNGAKYRTWFGWNSWGQWCAVFTSWCAEQAGVTAAGCAPKDAAVSNWITWYSEHPEAGELLDGAETVPQSGDFIIWKRELDPDACYESHIGVVTGYDPLTNTVYTVEGNLGGGLGDVMKCSYDANAAVTFYARPASSGTGLAGCAALAGGTTVDVPEGLGKSKTYMGWSLVDDPSSAQYRLRKQAGERYDEAGFAKIGSRFVIACTTTFGDVGDLVDFTLADGTVIECIVGDIKDQDDPGCNLWGHDDGQTVLEFVVETASWYAGAGHANPGTASCRPEWSAPVDFAVNLGSWFGGAGASSSTGLALAGCSTTARTPKAAETKLQGAEKALVEGLMDAGMDRVHAAAAAAAAMAAGGIGSADADRGAEAAAEIAEAYGSWAATERLAFEGISDVAGAAVHFGKYFAGLAEETDWDALAASAEDLLGRSM